MSAELKAFKKLKGNFNRNPVSLHFPQLQIDNQPTIYLRRSKFEQVVQRLEPIQDRVVSFI